MIVCVNEGTHELVIKRSRFIAVSKHIDSRDDVKPMIDELKRLHAQARHVCYGFISDEKGDEFGYDDNGEPSGTAGKPIYSALAASGARKTCIAVVRYFGGIKLGAGGLTRAYRQSAAELIDSVGTSTAQKYAVMSVACNAELYKKASGTMLAMGCKIEHISYAESVRCTASIEAERKSELISALAALGAEYADCGEKYVFTDTRE